MAKVYIARCIVKRNGKRYEKGNIINGLTAEEIKKGLAEKWLTEVGSGVEPTVEKASKPKSGKQKGRGTPSSGQSATERDALAKKAVELGLDVTDEMTAEEIEQLIVDVEAGGDDEVDTSKNELIERAVELGIDVTDEMTAEEIEQLIDEKEAGAK